MRNKCKESQLNEFIIFSIVGPELCLSIRFNNKKGEEVSHLHYFHEVIETPISGISSPASKLL